LGVYPTSTHGVALVQIWNVCQKCRSQKSPINRHLGTIAQLYRAISSQLTHASTCTCAHNMAHFGSLTAEIGSGVCVKFQWVSRLAFVTAATSKLCKIFGRLLAWYTIYTFSVALAPWRNFILLSFFFFPRLISAVADWISTILPHMVWP